MAKGVVEWEGDPPLAACQATRLGRSLALPIPARHSAIRPAVLARAMEGWPFRLKRVPPYVVAADRLGRRDFLRHGSGVQWIYISGPWKQTPPGARMLPWRTVGPNIPCQVAKEQSPTLFLRACSHSTQLEASPLFFPSIAKSKTQRTWREAPAHGLSRMNRGNSLGRPIAAWRPDRMWAAGLRAPDVGLELETILTSK